MRRSTSVRLVVIGATGLGLAAYGLQQGPGTPAAQPAHCGDSRDDPACDTSGQGSHGSGGVSGGAGGGAAGAARRDQTEGRAGTRGGEAGEAAASHGVARGGFGEAGGAHGGGGE